MNAYVTTILAGAIIHIGYAARIKDGHVYLRTTSAGLAMFGCAGRMSRVYSMWAVDGGMRYLLGCSLQKS